MKIVSALEARTHFGKLLDRVANGEQIVITRYDKPIARLVPESTPSVDTVRRAAAGLRELQQQVRRRLRAKLTDRNVRSAIEKGRR